MIINIAICDDETVFIEQLRSKLLNYSTELKTNNKITTFNNPDELLKKIDEIDILFLDVDMPGMNGIEAAKKIRKTNDSILIIFVSNYDQYVYQSIKYKPFRYIRKNRLNIELYPALKDAYKNLLLENSNKKITIKLNRGNTAINKRDIVCIEKELKDTVIYISDNKIITKMNLKDIEKELDEASFVKLHRGCIVNMKYIESYEKNVVQLFDKTIKEISRRKTKDVKDKIKKYWLLKS